jgi:hypothetical protein
MDLEDPKQIDDVPVKVAHNNDRCWDLEKRSEFTQT